MAGKQFGFIRSVSWYSAWSGRGACRAEDARRRPYALPGSRKPATNSDTVFEDGPAVVGLDLAHPCAEGLADLMVLLRRLPPPGRRLPRSFSFIGRVSVPVPGNGRMSSRHHHDLLRCASANDPTSTLPAFRPHVDTWSATFTMSRLCSDHQYGIASSPPKRSNTRIDWRTSSKMEARGGFVQDVEGVSRIAFAQLGGQLDALCSPPERVVLLWPRVTPSPSPRPSGVRSFRGRCRDVWKVSKASSTSLRETHQACFGP